MDFVRKGSLQAEQIKGAAMEKYVVIKDADHFVPQHIFECGQCFRFNCETDGSYTLVAKKKVINVFKKETGFSPIKYKALTTSSI